LARWYEGTWQKKTSVRGSVLPVIRIALQRHDGDDPHAIRLFEVEERIRKILRQVPAHVAVDPSETVRCGACLGDQALDLVVEARAPNSGLMPA